jgi:hypothetical protein
MALPIYTLTATLSEGKETPFDWYVRIQGQGWAESCPMNGPGIAPTAAQKLSRGDIVIWAMGGLQLEPHKHIQEETKTVKDKGKKETRTLTHVGRVYLICAIHRDRFN